MDENTSPVSFTEQEKNILHALQGSIPLTLTPFADIAAQTGMDEAQVIDLIKTMKSKGYIRRFGATLRHQKAGYSANAMVAWYVEDDQDIQAVGKQMAARPEISHCYDRTNCMDWPYNMYTMIHGKTQEDCLRVVQELIQETGVTQYDLLFSIKELKKTSMRYF
ncbi:MAG: Lrp/AsnC family transcriptional regulator [Desulfoplanes sp.]|nr:Lrp/AsnC family transcriptional regulator [Desulfoplanes sp.]